MSLKLNPHVSVDCVVFGFDGQSLNVLLIDRNDDVEHTKIQIKEHTQKLPGSLVFDDEDIDTAANRVLQELTGLTNIYLQQFHVFGSPLRLNKKEDLDWLQSTTGMKVNRVVTIAYFSLIKLTKNLVITGKTNWCKISEIPELVFDHKEIIERGLQTLRKEIQNEPVIFELLPKKFTIRQLQTLYEIIIGKKLDNRNFRKSISKWGYIIAIDEKEKFVAHKPAQFFKFDKKIYQKKRAGYFTEN
jgi:hypothetical protein